MACRKGLRRDKAPPGTLIQQRIKGFVPKLDGLFVDHAASLQNAIRQGNPSTSKKPPHQILLFFDEPLAAKLSKKAGPPHIGLARISMSLFQTSPIFRVSM